LSDALGVALFHCDGRRMLPTAPAQALHEGTRDLFAALHGIERALAPWRATAQPREEARSARVGAPQHDPLAPCERI
jgi:DNA-binding transcriptional LysR family regulator